MNIDTYAIMLQNLFGTKKTEVTLLLAVLVLSFIKIETGFARNTAGHFNTDFPIETENKTLEIPEEKRENNRPTAAPLIITPGTVNVVEGSNGMVINVEALDEDEEALGGLVYNLIGNIDDTLFTITANFGEIYFRASPDFETPLDAGADNIYTIEVEVCDTETLCYKKVFQITVFNIDEDGDGVTGAAEPNDLDPCVPNIHGVSIGDCDGDGLTNGQEDVNGNWVCDLGETCADNPDMDNDGILDGVEVNGPDGNPGTIEDNSDPLNPCDPNPFAFPGGDCDGDGLTNEEEDTNGNGICDAGETCADNSDMDNDGILDGAEIANGTDPFNPCDPNLYAVADGDCDGDGLTNSQEDANGNGICDAGETCADNPDMDDDGFLDGIEVATGTNPLNACEPNIYEIGSSDCDGDGLTNGQEDTNGNGICDGSETCADNPDMDNDGIWDGVEIANGTNPLDPCDPNPFAFPEGDCDNDGLTNAQEDANRNGICDGPETCADNPDMDNDGISDGAEIANGSDPLLPCDPNPYGYPDGDCDYDGLTNGQEDANGNGICDADETCADHWDRDGDGLPDGTEVSSGYDPFDPCDPSAYLVGNSDCDGDGLTNAEEDTNGNYFCDGNETCADNPDMDNDGIPDGTELANGSDPLNPCDPNPYAISGGDCDNDGLTNEQEDENGNGICDDTETCGDNPDTDNDGITDGTEVANASDPLSACDPNPYAVPSGDCDRDGLTNGEEDTNGNGICDAGETCADVPDELAPTIEDFEENSNFEIENDALFRNDVAIGGNLHVFGQVFQPSDRKLKENIKAMENSLEQLKKINPVTYDFKTEEYGALNLPKGKQYGVIAQELAEVFPDFVKNKLHTNVEGLTIKAVDYNKLIPVLVAAIQELNADLEAKEQEIAGMKSTLAEIAEIKATLATLQKNMEENKEEER